MAQIGCGVSVTQSSRHIPRFDKNERDAGWCCIGQDLGMKSGDWVAVTGILESGAKGFSAPESSSEQHHQNEPDHDQIIYIAVGPD